MESPLQERVWLVCLADMARTFEYVLHFVRCATVTVSPNQIIIIIIIDFGEHWQMAIMQCAKFPLFLFAEVEVGTYLQ